MNQQLQATAATEIPRAHHVEPFSQFQGFSSVTTRHDQHMRPRFGVYGYHIPEGEISPRMAIPNPAAWESPQPRVQTLVKDTDGKTPQSRIFQSCCNPDSGSNFNVNSDQYEAVTHRWPPSHLCNVTYPPTPPYMDLNDFGQLSDNLQEGYHGGTPPTPVPLLASRHPNTFRVPSDSEPGHLSGTLGLPLSNALSDVSEAVEEADPIPSSTLGDGASTIYPEDSISIASRTGPPPDIPQQRTLADEVMAVHDICLAATQRYLENLRVNWDLRNGRPVGGEDAHSLQHGPVRSHNRRRADRWAPYTKDGSRRRARSESHLEHMALGSNGEHHQDGGRHHTALATNVNPIPSFTNSLLHNIRHICDLIWRRAQRDREDVLGAEAWGCREMSFLHECGEAIVLYNATDAERDPRGSLHRVVVAGTGICRQLKDWDSVRLMGDGALAGDEEGEGW